MLIHKTIYFAYFNFHFMQLQSFFCLLVPFKFLDRSLKLFPLHSTDIYLFIHAEFSSCTYVAFSFPVSCWKNPTQCFAEALLWISGQNRSRLSRGRAVGQQISYSLGEETNLNKCTCVCLSQTRVRVFVVKPGPSVHNQSTQSHSAPLCVPSLFYTFLHFLWSVSVTYSWRVHDNRPQQRAPSLCQKNSF